MTLKSALQVLAARFALWHKTSNFTLEELTMVRCDVCNKMIVTNAKVVGEVRVCSDKCVARSAPVLRAEAAVAEQVRATALQIHRGPCGRCDGSGPVDAHSAHSIWSLVYLTSWNSKTHICCRSCGRRAQWKALGLASLLGWWGLPWGLIYTPVQLFKNLRDIARGPASIAPSDELQSIIRADLVQRYLDAEVATQSQNGSASMPPVLAAPTDYSGAQVPLRPPIPTVPPAASTGSLFKKSNSFD